MPIGPPPRTWPPALLMACPLAFAASAWAAPLPTGATALTGEVMVRLEEDDPALLARLLARDDVVEAEHRAGAWPVWSLTLSAGSDPFTVAGSLARLPGLRWAYPDLRVQGVPHSLPLNDLYLSEEWHLENVAQVEGGLPGADINILPAWEITDGAGQLIGIVDGGVQDSHPDLRVSPSGIDALDGDTDANPGEGQGNPGHGTLVAGVAAAVGDNDIGVAGVAYGATVFPVRLIGGEASLATMYDAYIGVVDAGASVLNNSWGFNPPEPCDPISDFPPLNEALEYARVEGRGGLGTVVVFSAGNAGCEQNQYPLITDNVGVIAVASSTDQDRKWGYSVWGRHVDLAAPSGPTGGGSRPGLWSTDMWGDDGFNGAGDNNEYSPYMGGTSGAAPVVSGTVALMLAANPRLREDQVRRVLCETAHKIDPLFAEYDATGWSPYYGCGRVDAGAAVTAVANAAPPAPTWLAPGDGSALLRGDPLRFSVPEDPDGDVLTFDLSLRLLAGDDDDSAAPGEEELRSGLLEPEYALRGLNWPAGQYVARVAARDSWGTGAWSEELRFVLTEPPPPPAPEPEEGCGQGASAALLLLIPLGLRRRDYGAGGGAA